MDGYSVSDASLLCVVFIVLGKLEWRIGHMLIVGCGRMWKFVWVVGRVWMD